MARIGLTRHLTIPEHVVHQKVDEEMVLLNLETGVYHGLDKVGSRFWELLLGQQSLQRVFDQMLAEYTVSPEKLEEDLLRLVRELETQKLICVAG